jgi:hypothetical protein
MQKEVSIKLLFKTHELIEQTNRQPI